MNTEEILDIVSENDEVISAMPRSLVYERKISAFRAINAFIVNSHGQLWIPRRHPSKKLFPLALDMSVGGHVSSGETYEESFIRETAEEVNIHLNPGDFSVIGRLTPHTHGTSAFMYVYIIKSDETPNYNPNDFVESYWLHPDELLERIENGDASKDDLPIVVRALKAEFAAYK